MKWFIVGVIAVVGVLAAVVGIVYLVEPIHSLPSFFPGSGKYGTGIRYKKGAAALGAAVVLWVVAIVAAMAVRKRAATAS